MGVEGYTSESPVHWVTKDYPSLLIQVSVLLLYVLGSILHTLRGEEALFNKTDSCTYTLCLKQQTSHSFEGFYVHLRSDTQVY